MPHPDNGRKRKFFRVALVLAEKTAAQWAKDQGITPSYLSQVLAGKKESLSLAGKMDAFAEEKIGAFTEEWLKQVA